ncbi:MAG: zinc-ribbon domain-containing protein [Candidatus Hermodarchaeota archaeon]
MPRNNSIVGSIIGLVFFIGFGVFFLFGGGFFSFFHFFPIFPIIFIIVLFGIVAAASASSRNSTCCPPKSQSHYQHYPQEVKRSNPYIVKNQSIPTVRQIYIEDDEPAKPIASFCQFCGTKRDTNAKYCHSCGTKLH